MLSLQCLAAICHSMWFPGFKVMPLSVLWSPAFVRGIRRLEVVRAGRGSAFKCPSSHCDMAGSYKYMALGGPHWHPEPSPLAL